MLDEYKKNIRKPNPSYDSLSFWYKRASLNMSGGLKDLDCFCLNDGGMGSTTIYVFTAERNNINDFCQ